MGVQNHARSATFALFFDLILGSISFDSGRFPLLLVSQAFVVVLVFNEVVFTPLIDSLLILHHLFWYWLLYRTLVDPSGAGFRWLLIGLCSLGSPQCQQFWVSGFHIGSR